MGRPLKKLIAHLQKNILPYNIMNNQINFQMLPNTKIQNQYFSTVYGPSANNEIKTSKFPLPFPNKPIIILQTNQKYTFDVCITKTIRATGRRPTHTHTQRPIIFQPTYKYIHWSIDRKKR